VLLLDIPVAYLVVVKCCGLWGTAPWRLLEPQTWLVTEATIPLYMLKTTRRKYNLVLECSRSSFVCNISVTSRRIVDVHFVSVYVVGRPVMALGLYGSEYFRIID